MESSSSTASVALGVYWYNWVNDQVISHFYGFTSLLGFQTTSSSNNIEVVSRARKPPQKPISKGSGPKTNQAST
ncbi:hypothetical protein ACET3Z_015218 [Daucus carota]